jgi:hypothetical protein
MLLYACLTYEEMALRDSLLLIFVHSIPAFIWFRLRNADLDPKFWLVLYNYGFNVA